MSCKLKDLEAFAISSIVDSMAAVLVTDNMGNFISVNDTFCELTEYSREELIGKPASIFKSGVHPDEFYKTLWETLLAGKRWRGLFCNKTKTGKLIWLDTIIDPIYNSEHKIEKFIGVRFNVTEDVLNKFTLKSQEKQLDLASKFATIGEISGHVAHEINNPLTIMNFSLNALNSALDEPKTDVEKIKKLSTKMSVVTNRIAKIVLALRNFSRNDSYKMEPVSLSEILEDVILFTDDITKSDSIDFKIESEIADHVLVECHKNQISQVMINLIKNACDAIRLLEKREIILKTKISTDFIEIKVIDSGQKIPDEMAESFFTPYYTTKSEGKGTGIGLTISRKIIEAHGGKIFLDRTYDQTCFVVIIPKKCTIQPGLRLVKGTEKENKEAA